MGGSPKHYPTFRVAQTTALSKSLEVSTTGSMLGRGYGRIDSSAATDDYFIQLINAVSLPNNGASIANGNLVFISSPITISHTNGTHSLFDFDFSEDYVKSSKGIFIAVSTTEYSLTLTESDILTCTVFYH